MRFPPFLQSELTAQQQELIAFYKEGWRAAVSPSKGVLGGPFEATLRSPELAKRLAAVSDYFRTGTALPPRLNELAILVVASQVRSDFEWFAHCSLALASGISAATVHALANGNRPNNMKSDEALVYEVATTLIQRGTFSDDLFHRAIDVLGERQVVDLVGVCGYYSSVAMMLSAADVHAPRTPYFVVPEEYVGLSANSPEAAS